MKARLTVELTGDDAPVLATAVEPDVTSELPGASVTRTGTAEFEVAGDELAAFRAACNTLLRLVATGSDVTSQDGPAGRPGS